MDFNLSSEEKYNHKGIFLNILFSDGHVKGIPDRERTLTLNDRVQSEYQRVFLQGDEK